MTSAVLTRIRSEVFLIILYASRDTRHSPNTVTMPFLRIGYKRIHYADLKPEGSVRETFIFMHGLGSSQDYYHAVTQGLLAKGFRCIIFDSTGAGRSPYTFIEQSIQSLADDVIGILDALEVSKAVFCGHSMGGYAEHRTTSTWMVADWMQHRGSAFGCRAK